MVEIMERRGEAEWSPDMELEGCDAEKAAALLLSVAPRCRSRSSEAIREGEEDACKKGLNVTDIPMTVQDDDNATSTAVNSSSSEIGEGALTPPIDPVAGPGHHARADSIASSALPTVSSPSLSSSSPIPTEETTSVSSKEASSTGAVFTYPWDDRGRSAGLSPRGEVASFARSKPESTYESSGSREVAIRESYERAGAAMSGDDEMNTGEQNVEGERDYRSVSGGYPISPHSVTSNGMVSGAASSPRRDGSSAGSEPGPCMLLSLAEFATKELMTMGKNEPHPRRRDERASSPLRSRPFSSREHFDPMLSLPQLSPRSSAAVAALSEAATSAMPARHHGHHLRERGSSRGYSAYRSRQYHDEDGEEEEEDEERSGFGGSARAVNRRRNRPRSVSMPEGMELQATRAFGGSCSSPMRHGSSRIEAIKEELDGYDVGPGTRSRVYRGGSSGPRGLPVGARERMRHNDLLLDNVEDAKVLIGLGRPPDRWPARASKEEEEEEEDEEDDEEEFHGGRGARGGDGDEDGGGGSGEGEVDGEGVCVSLPHMLAKYADMYNKNGRIGIYTRQEREAIIARFKRKRLRRVWKKKIRYNCRKNLADKRLRVKGRFVKMSAEQRTALKLKHKALRGGRSGSGAGSSLAGGGGASSRTDSSASAGSMDMDLLTGEDMMSETGSGGSGSGAPGDGFEDEHGEGQEEELDEERGSDEYPQEPPKRVRRHSIAY